MNYLISMQHCYFENDKIVEIIPYAKYEIKITDENVLFFGDFLPQVVNFSSCENVEKITHGVDNFFLLDFKSIKDSESVSLTFKNKPINVNCGRDLNITYNGNNIFEIENCCLNYSHFETFNGFCLIYFCGKRNFVVCLKDDVEFASFYDEINLKDKERYFMCRCHDILNQGKVFHLTEKVEEYYVYLDNYDLNMKSQFVSCVFLDCILTSNLKYANELLVDDMKKQDEKIIKTFFPVFDCYVILDENLFLLKNKNTLAGIFKFEIINNKINNIIQL